MFITKFDVTRHLSEAMRENVFTWLDKMTDSTKTYELRNLLQTWYEVGGEGYRIRSNILNEYKRRYGFDGECEDDI